LNKVCIKKTTENLYVGIELPSLGRACLVNQSFYNQCEDHVKKFLLSLSIVFALSSSFTTFANEQIYIDHAGVFLASRLNKQVALILEHWRSNPAPTEIIYIINATNSRLLNVPNEITWTHRINIKNAINRLTSLNKARLADHFLLGPNHFYSSLALLLKNRSNELKETIIVVVLHPSNLLEPLAIHATLDNKKAESLGLTPFTRNATFKVAIPDNRPTSFEELQPPSHHRTAWSLALLGGGLAYLAWIMEWGS
jgi:hypothetical protein